MNDQKIKRIGFILVDGFSLMSLSSAVEPLRAANHLSGETLFDITFIPASGTRASSSVGIISEGKSIEESGYDFDLFFLNDTATTEIYTRSIVGSVRCV